MFFMISSYFKIEIFALVWPIGDAGRKVYWSSDSVPKAPVISPAL